MNLNLHHLSNEELGKLFPVSLTLYDPEWPVLFQKERFNIISLIGEFGIGDIQHFGSTAIPTIKSKPTIDILIEVPHHETINKHFIKIMGLNKYHYILMEDTPPPYGMFVKGYTEKGFRGQAYHLHIAPKSHHILWDRLLFKDYLINNPVVAKEYEKIKIELANKFPNNREDYTKGKSAFVNKIMDIILRL